MEFVGHSKAVSKISIVKILEFVALPPLNSRQSRCQCHHMPPSTYHVVSFDFSICFNIEMPKVVTYRILARIQKN